jgi:hypothetical protein
VHVHPLSLHLPSPVKLQCTLPWADILTLFHQRENMYSVGTPLTNGVNVFRFLSSLPLFPPSITREVWVLPVISLPVSWVWACLSIWWERFRGTQKEDEYGPLSIKSSLPPTNKNGRGGADSRSRIYERTISLKFLGIIFRVLRLESSGNYKTVSNPFCSRGVGGLKSVRRGE